SRADADRLAPGAPLPRPNRTDRDLRGRDVRLPLLRPAVSRLRSRDDASGQGVHATDVRAARRLDPRRDDLRPGADGTAVAGGSGRVPPRRPPPAQDELLRPPPDEARRP